MIRRRRIRSAARIATAILVVLAALTPVPRARAAPPVASEYELKAAFLYNFAKFIEWPPQVFELGDGVAVCILGENPFGDLLDRTLVGKTVHDRPLVVRRHDRMDQMAGCHVLFVSAGEARALGRIAPPADGPMLTVGENEDFLEQGGMIAFAMEENRLRFEINADAAERAGLKISSQLLKLATRIRRTP